MPRNAGREAAQKNQLEKNDQCVVGIILSHVGWGVQDAPSDPLPGPFLAPSLEPGRCVGAKGVQTNPTPARPFFEHPGSRWPIYDSPPVRQRGHLGDIIARPEIRRRRTFVLVVTGGLARFPQEEEGRRAYKTNERHSLSVTSFLHDSGCAQTPSLCGVSGGCYSWCQ